MQEVTRVSFSLTDETFYRHEVTGRAPGYGPTLRYFWSNRKTELTQVEATKAITVCKWPVLGSVMPDTYKQGD